MKLLSLNCNQCGAPLEVPKTTKFATCSYCNAHLSVHDSGNAVYSEVIEAIEQRTDKIADEVERLKLLNELHQLDGRWNSQRERYQIRGRHGQLQVPTKTGGIFSMAAAGFFGLLFIGLSLSSNGPPTMLIFGVLFIGVGIIGGLTVIAKAQDYEQNRQRFDQQRRELLRRLDRRG